MMPSRILILERFKNQRLPGQQRTRLGKHIHKRRLSRTRRFRPSNRPSRLICTRGASNQVHKCRMCTRQVSNQLGRPICMRRGRHHHHKHPACSRQGHSFLVNQHNSSQGCIHPGKCFQINNKHNSNQACTRPVRCCRGNRQFRSSHRSAASRGE